ncbi:MAG: hypothetical protein BJ554DRAFT_1047 [Olpidium bornovanus]|uniref:Uncharacterized protein n=1 Tax=Olpidium bornovanus TaxID=278681 RepID=A0A8H7ZS88_9FUNG|nr:MAG: hypothetical protein BJ554DRAFT_1047 [Olpidium bornovanus]
MSRDLRRDSPVSNYGELEAESSRTLAAGEETAPPARPGISGRRILRTRKVILRRRAARRRAAAPLAAGLPRPMRFGCAQQEVGRRAADAVRNLLPCPIPPSASPSLQLPQPLPAQKARQAELMATSLPALGSAAAGTASCRPSAPAGSPALGPPQAAAASPAVRLLADVCERTARGVAYCFEFDEWGNFLCAATVTAPGAAALAGAKRRRCEYGFSPLSAVEAKDRAARQALESLRIGSKTPESAYSSAHWPLPPKVSGLPASSPPPSPAGGAHPSAPPQPVPLPQGQPVFSDSGIPANPLRHHAGVSSRRTSASVAPLAADVTLVPGYRRTAGVGAKRTAGERRGLTETPAKPKRAVTGTGQNHIGSFASLRPSAYVTGGLPATMIFAGRSSDDRAQLPKGTLTAPQQSVILRTRRASSLQSVILRIRRASSPGDRSPKSATERRRDREREAETGGAPQGARSSATERRRDQEREAETGGAPQEAARRPGTENTKTED